MQLDHYPDASLRTGYNEVRQSSLARKMLVSKASLPLSSRLGHARLPRRYASRNDRVGEVLV